MTQNEIARIVVDTALHVHRSLGPALLESVYLEVMVHELRKRGLRVKKEVPISVVWDGVNIESAFRADIIIAGMVIVELKSVEAIAPVHKKQLLTYLRLTQIQLGLLINFGAEFLKDGVHRVVNGLKG